MAGIKPSVGGVLEHQTLPCLRLDVRLFHYLAIVGWVCAHQHLQLVWQLTNGEEICDGRFVAEVEHHEERSVKPVKLSEVREDTGVRVDVAEPSTVKRKLRLTQRAEETVLSQDRTFIFLLGLEDEEQHEEM